MINDSSSLTQFSASIRGSKSYFFETLFQATGAGFVNQAIVDFTSILRDISRYTDRPVLVTVSVSDYIIKHETGAGGFTEDERQVLAVNSPELTKGQTRYMTLIPNDQGVGLFGSNALILETLPANAIFRLGFVNPVDPSDTTIYPPNTAVTFEGLQPFASQQLVYAIVRFRIQAQFL